MKDVKGTKKYSLYRAISNYDWRLVEELYKDVNTHYNWMVFDAIATGCYKSVEFFVSVGEAPTDRDITTARTFQRGMILELLLENEI